MTKKGLENFVNENSKKVHWGFYIPGCFILLAIGIFFLYKGGNFHDTYTDIQKPLFLEINETLSAYPDLENNLTNIGNSLVSLSLLSIFLHFAPKIWGALINASILSLIFTGLFKRLFQMPRPASVIEHTDFTIIGQTLYHNSFPSGHSITIFILITLLFLFFLPRNRSFIIKWCIFAGVLLAMGLFIAATRIACGAHWPLDVITGASIGYILTIIGVRFNNRYSIWRWIEDDKFRIVRLIIVLVLLGLMISKILISSLLVIDGIAIAFLLVTIVLLSKKLCLKRV